MCSPDITVSKQWNYQCLTHFCGVLVVKSLAVLLCTDDPWRFVHETAHNLDGTTDALPLHTDTTLCTPYECPPHCPKAAVQPIMSIPNLLERGRKWKFHAPADLNLLISIVDT